MKNKIFTYPAIVKEDEEEGYEIYIPDFNEYTYSDTKEESYYMGTELLELILVEYFAKHIMSQIPKPSDIHFNDLKDDEILIYVSTSKESVKNLMKKYKKRK